jgi:hypothetical protein
VEGIDGKPVKSRHDWYIYLKWFESSILETKGMGRVIDATEGGAKIHGTEIMTLREAIDQYCLEQIDVKRIMTEMPVTFSEQELQHIYEYLEHAYLEVQAFPKLAREIVALCNKGLNEVKKENRPSKLAQIGKQIVERNMAIAEKVVYTLVDNIVKHDAMKEVQDMCVINEDEKEGFVQTYESTKKIFYSVGTASTEIEPLLKEAVEVFKKTLRSEMDVR